VGVVLAHELVEEDMMASFPLPLKKILTYLSIHPGWDNMPYTWYYWDILGAPRTADSVEHHWH